MAGSSPSPAKCGALDRGRPRGPGRHPAGNVGATGGQDRHKRALIGNSLSDWSDYMAKTKAKPQRNPKAQKPAPRPTTRRKATPAPVRQAAPLRPVVPATRSATTPAQTRVQPPHVALGMDDRLVIDVGGVTRDLPALQERAKSAGAIETQDARTGAYNFLRTELRPRIAQLRGLFSRIKQSILSAHKDALAEERKVLAPYLALDDRIENAILAFDEAQRKKREEEQRQREEEARQREIAAAAGAGGEDALSDAESLLETAQELEEAAAELAQDDPESAREAADAAKELRRQATAIMPAPAPPPPPAPTKREIKAQTKGATITHHAEVRDVALLVREIAAGRVDIAAIEPTKLMARDGHPWLNTQARERGDQLSIPGVVAVPDQSIR